MFLEGGGVFSHEAVYDRETRFAALLAVHLRAKQRGKLVAPDTSVEPTLGYMGDGATCTTPSIATVLSSTPGSARWATWMRRGGFSGRRSGRSATPPAA